MCERERERENKCDKKKPSTICEKIACEKERKINRKKRDMRLDINGYPRIVETNQVIYSTISASPPY